MDVLWIVLILSIGPIQVLPTLLESLQPRPDNPPELNEFLTNVLDHENDFIFAKRIAQQYKNLRRNKYSIDADYTIQNDPLIATYDDYPNIGYYEKRHAHNNHNLHKKQFAKGKEIGQYQRYRRGAFNTNDANKMPVERDLLKQLISAVHHTAGKAHKNLNRIGNDKNDDLCYINLKDSKKKQQQKDDDNLMMKRGEMSPLTQSEAPNELRKTLRFDNSIEMSAPFPPHLEKGIDQKQIQQQQQQQQQQQSITYSEKQPISDSNGFEEALTYDVETGPHEKVKVPVSKLENKNNVELLFGPVEKTLRRDNVPTNFDNVNFQQNDRLNANVQKFIDNEIQERNLNLKDADEADLSEPAKIVKHIGRGFAEISKNDDVPSYLSLASRQTRKLQFIDESMLNFDDDDVDENDDFGADYKKRARRNFLDALGMKNEDDYGEDLQNRDELELNNTCSGNHSKSTTQLPHHEGGVGHCMVEEHTTKTTTTTQRHNSVDDIKQILNEPKEMNNEKIFGNFKHIDDLRLKKLSKIKKIKKKRRDKDPRHKKDKFSRIEDFNDIVEEENGETKLVEPREMREVDAQYQTAVLAIKNRLNNPNKRKEQEEMHERNLNLKNADEGDLTEPAKIVKHIERGFAEISKNDDDPSYLSLASRQTRKLQFIDESMLNFDDDDEDDDFGADYKKRARRNFLDTLGMKNEDDYGEDLQNRDELELNNTCSGNHSKSTTQLPHHEGGVGHCMVEEHTTKTTTTTQRHNSVEDIKQILNEPKEMNNEKIFGNFKHIDDLRLKKLSKIKKVKKKRRDKDPRHKKEKFSRVEDFDDIVEEKNGETELVEPREMREADAQYQTAVLAIKNRLNNPNKKKEQEEEGERRERTIPWSKTYKIITGYERDKKEDLEPEIGTEKSAVTVESDKVTEADLANSTYEQLANQMDAENEKLVQLVNGHLACKIVSKVYDAVNNRQTLKTRFMSGLSQKHSSFGTNIELDIFKSNGTEDVNEARLLLTQMSRVLNRLVLNQVRRKLCQRLDDDLKTFLITITEVKNAVDWQNYMPNSDQGDFLFAYQEQEMTPPFDMQKLQATLVTLEGLLLSYRNLNANCQAQAEPVKDYIQKHVKMLKKVVACPNHLCGKRSNNSYKKLVQHQLASVGLGDKGIGFIPNFSINRIIQNKMMKNELKSKSLKRDGILTDDESASDARSVQFKKLQVAAEKMRQRRKIGEVFGEDDVSDKEKRSAEFEHPVVFHV